MKTKASQLKNNIILISDLNKVNNIMIAVITLLFSTLMESQTYGQGNPITVSTTNVSCYGEADGSATINITDYYFAAVYTWSPNVSNSATATDLTAGIYSVTVSYCTWIPCSNRTTKSITFEIFQPLPILVDVNKVDVSCNGYSNGNISVEGYYSNPDIRGTFGYQWSNNLGNNSYISGLSGGIYTVTITDLRSHYYCSVIQDVVINEPDKITATYDIKNVSCFGFNDGQASINVSGGNGEYSYFWQPGGNTSKAITNASPGKYTIEVHDRYQCNAIFDDVYISEPDLLLTKIINTDISCYRANDGQIEIQVSGGKLPYKYHWNPQISNTEHASELEAGRYFITIEDANGCKNEDEAQINEPKKIENSIHIEGDSLIADQEGAKYQWINCSTGRSISSEMDQVFVPGSSGSFAVDITLGACTERTECLYFIPTYTEDNNSEFTKVVYPNPNQGKFSILSEQPITKIRLISIAGQEIFNYNSDNSNIENIEANLIPGLYLLYLTTNNSMFIKKVIVE